MEIQYDLYVLTDKALSKGRPMVEIVEQAIQGGATLVQYRAKNACGRDMVQEALALLEVTRCYRVPLIVNDRVDVALAVDADGVHLGRDDGSLADARLALGPEKIVGATAKTVEAAKKAEADGADYVGVGAIYPTTTHDKPVRTSVDSLKAIAEAVNIGVLAIGGLTADNVHILKNTGNNGACVVRYLMQSDDVTADVKRLRDALREE